MPNWRHLLCLVAMTLSIALGALQVAGSALLLISAAGFQLKGNGWYVTDFKDKGKKPASSASGTDKDKAASGSDKHKDESTSSSDKPAAEAKSGSDSEKPAEKKKEEKAQA